MKTNYAIPSPAEHPFSLYVEGLRDNERDDPLYVGVQGLIRAVNLAQQTYHGRHPVDFSATSINWHSVADAIPPGAARGLSAHLSAPCKETEIPNDPRHRANRSFFVQRVNLANLSLNDVQWGGVDLRGEAHWRFERPLSRPGESQWYFDWNFRYPLGKKMFKALLGAGLIEVDREEKSRIKSLARQHQKPMIAEIAPLHAVAVTEAGISELQRVVAQTAQESTEIERVLAQRRAGDATRIASLITD